MPEFLETEWLARTADVQVRVNTLRPDDGTAWHFHTAVTDTVFCLEEGLEDGRGSRAAASAGDSATPRCPI